MDVPAWALLAATPPVIAPERDGLETATHPGREGPAVVTPQVREQGAALDDLGVAQGLTSLVQVAEIGQVDLDRAGRGPAAASGDPAVGRRLEIAQGLATAIKVAVPAGTRGSEILLAGRGGMATPTTAAIGTAMATRMAGTGTTADATGLVVVAGVVGTRPGSAAIGVGSIMVSPPAAYPPSDFGAEAGVGAVEAGDGAEVGAEVGDGDCRSAGLAGADGVSRASGWGGASTRGHSARPFISGATSLISTPIGIHSSWFNPPLSWSARQSREWSSTMRCR